MNKSDMLESLINYYTDGNKARFAAMLGIKAQNVSAWITRHTFDAELIYSKCRGVSAEWLLSGIGEMLIEKQKDTENKAIVQGDHSITAVKSAVSLGGNATNYAEADVCAVAKPTDSTDNIETLRQRVDLLQQLLADKERTIKILMERK